MNYFKIFTLLACFILVGCSESDRPSPSVSNTKQVYSPSTMDDDDAILNDASAVSYPTPAQGWTEIGSITGSRNLCVSKVSDPRTSMHIAVLRIPATYKSANKLRNFRYFVRTVYLDRSKYHLHPCRSY